MTAEFGIGLVGAGFISRESHAPSVRYIPDAAVAGILNPTESTATALAEECRETGAGDPAVYGEGEVGDLVADPAVDGLWVASPNDTRVGVVEAAVAALRDGAALDGIAFEKPVARTVTEARRVLSLVEEAGVPTAYLENWAHDGDRVAMKELLWEHGRDAGRPYIARSRAEHGGPHAAWFWDGRRQGGGALTDMLCHALAGNEFLFADPDGMALTPVAVSADTETLKWTQPEYAEQLEAEYGVDFAERPSEDYARATVTYETADGRPVVSEATGSWCYVGAGVSASTELLGPEYSGQVRTDETSSSVFLSEAVGAGEGWAEKQNATSGRLPVAGSEVDGAYVAENRDAVGAFRRGEDATLDVEDGARVVRLCMAAYRAAETGTEVDPRSADLDGYVPPPARE
jgi:predicted dehydrogenase